MANVLILHGGAPTAVINSSLAGVLSQLKKVNFQGKIFGARFGSKGLLEEDFIDLTSISYEEIEKIKRTPGSAIGTSRHHLEWEDYLRMAEILEAHNISYVLVNGGNGSMDTCGNLAKACVGKKIFVVGIPKTIDNDIMETDHAPGYASAGKYLAGSVREAICDIRGLPIHVSIIESMGRNVGWLTAMSALSQDENGDFAPDLLYLPEVAFDEEQFLSNVSDLYRKKGGVCVVASEGLKDKDGKEIVEPIFTVGRATYFGDVSSHLRDLIIKKLGIKARSEKPGLLQRCSDAYVSSIDREEAFMAGVEAVNCALAEKTAVMVALERVSTTPYVVKTKLVDINKVMLVERAFPKEYINADGTGVTKEFIEWARPLIDDLPDFKSFV